MKQILIIIALVLLGCAEKNPYPNWDNDFDPANQIAYPFLENDTTVKIGSIVVLAAPDTVKDKNIERAWYIPRDTLKPQALDTLYSGNSDTIDIATTIVGDYYYRLKLHYSFSNLTVEDTMKVTVLDTLPRKIYPLDSLQVGIIEKDVIGFYQARLRWERTFPGVGVSYRVRYGLTSDNLNNQVLVDTNQTTLTNLTINTIYYWSVEAIPDVEKPDSILIEPTIAHFKTKFPQGMVLIKGGQYTMGNDSLGENDEKPAHLVTVSDFWMDTTEITVQQYISITQDTNFAADTCLPCPKTRVNWYQAIRYANLLSTLYGADTVYSYTNSSKEYQSPTSGEIFLNLVVHDSVSGFRLPTEAEWEFAARGGTTTNFYWGDDTTGIHSNVFFDTTHAQPVAQLLPNQYGLYDMLGNVAEWVQDSYDSTGYEEDILGVINPLGPVTSLNNAVRRGCSWSEDSYTSCRVFDKIHDLTNKSFDSKNQTGFRLVFNIPD